MICKCVTKQHPAQKIWEEVKKNGLLIMSDDEMAAIGVPGNNNLADNLKTLSMRALSVNSPHSDNTTGTALRWND